METQTQKPLTTAEIGKLWGSFLNEKVIELILQVFLKQCQDQHANAVFEKALAFSHENQKWLSEFFQEEGLTEPFGFTEQDVNLEASPLFSDTFYMYYMIFLSKAGIINNGFAFIVSTREDVMDYYKETIRQSEVIYQSAKEALTKQGLFYEAPVIALSNGIEMASGKKYLGHVFSGKRKINSFEATELFASHFNSFVIHQLLTAFSNLDTQPDLNKFFIRGMEISGKHKQTFEDEMKKENVPVVLPIQNIQPVAKKKGQSPFSEKLLLAHTLVLCSFLSANYGHSISVSLRKDISLSFGKCVLGLESYLSEGAQLLVEKGWLEEPPQMV